VCARGTKPLQRCAPAEDLTALLATQLVMCNPRFWPRCLADLGQAIHSNALQRSKRCCIDALEQDGALIGGPELKQVSLPDAQIPAHSKWQRDAQAVSTGFVHRADIAAADPDALPDSYRRGPV
jgi:hypothetical protein